MTRLLFWQAYIGFVWEAIYEKKDGKLMRVHVLGPIFYSPYSDKAMEHCLRQYESLGMSFSSKHKLIAQMQELPVMKYSQFCPLWDDAALSGQWPAHNHE